MKPENYSFKRYLNPPPPPQKKKKKKKKKKERKKEKKKKNIYIYVLCKNNYVIVLK